MYPVALVLTVEVVGVFGCLFTFPVCVMIISVDVGYNVLCIFSPVVIKACMTIVTVIIISLQLYEVKAKQCSGFGTYKCGICECDKTHFGRTCECDSDNIHGATGLPLGGCRPDNTSVVDCSGRGTCICGVCECETRENPEEVRPYCEIRQEFLPAFAAVFQNCLVKVLSL
jgi:hypothetical protein